MTRESQDLVSKVITERLKPFLSLQASNRGVIMKLSKTEQKVIEHMKKCLTKQDTFDRIQYGVRFMDAIRSLINKGLIILLSTESSMYDHRKGIGKTASWQQAWTTAYTIRLSDNS